MAVTLRLISHPYVGVPIRIQFNRDGGVRRSDYITISHSGKRLKWEWCYGKTECQISSHGLGTYIVAYFEDGGAILPGTTIQRYSFQLQNPVISAHLDGDVTAGNTVPINVNLHVASSDLTLALKMHRRSGYMRIASIPLERSLTSFKAQLPCPRVPGPYKAVIHCRDMELFAFSVDVRPPPGLSVPLFKLELTCEDSTEAPSRTRVLVVSPNQPFFALASSPLLHPHEDVIVVRKANLITDRPQQSDLAPGGRVVPFQVPASIDQEGLYHVILGVRHNSTFLIGAWALLVVTSVVSGAPSVENPSKAHQWQCCLLPSSPPQASAMISTSPSTLQAMAAVSTMPSSCPLSLEPVALPPSSTFQAPDVMAAPSPTPAASVTSFLPLPCAEIRAHTEEFMCVVCQDRRFQIKFDPCKHVCLCEECWKQVQSGAIRTCPLCREKIEGFEKIYFA